MRYGQKYDLDSGYDPQRLIALVPDRYGIRKGGNKYSGIIFYDTFDWRLFNKSLVLYESGRKLFLSGLSDSNPLFSLKITSMPVFIWDFPDNKFREYLNAIIETRALLRLVELRSRSLCYNILNQHEKTVARFIYEEIRCSSERKSPLLSAHLLVQPVRGYTEDAQRVAEKLEESGLSRGRQDDIFLKGMEAAGKIPGSYSTRIEVPLDPAMRSDEAVKKILLFLMRIIRINESYIEKDIDTEFVHDFRVAVRRTRSALGQVKSVFPPDITERFKSDFSFLGRLSNELRDMDVYLLREEAYRKKLPSVLRDDITALFEYLRNKRKKAFQGFIREMKSGRFKRILKDWEAFLNEPCLNLPDAQYAATPVEDLARKIIFKKYKKVVKSGRRIIENSDDRMLHILRINCKKLRYLMEFFSSLFENSGIDRGIKLLKKLQDHLGDINDLRVQEEYLLEITGELPVNRKNANKTLAAIGSLIGELEREREMVKSLFSEIFRDFASHENRNFFEDLFS